MVTLKEKRRATSIRKYFRANGKYESEADQKWLSQYEIDHRRGYPKGKPRGVHVVKETVISEEKSPPPLSVDMGAEAIPIDDAASDENVGENTGSSSDKETDKTAPKSESEPQVPLAEMLAALYTHAVSIQPELDFIPEMEFKSTDGKVINLREIIFQDTIFPNAVKMIKDVVGEGTLDVSPEVVALAPLAVIIARRYFFKPKGKDDDKRPSGDAKSSYDGANKKSPTTDNTAQSRETKSAPTSSNNEIVHVKLTPIRPPLKSGEYV